MYVFFFFFQAEDGIRDDLVTGVQTCALPILFVILIIFMLDLSDNQTSINIIKMTNIGNEFVEEYTMLNYTRESPTVYTYPPKLHTASYAPSDIKQITTNSLEL